MVRVVPGWPSQSGSKHSTFGCSGKHTLHKHPVCILVKRMIMSTLPVMPRFKGMRSKTGQQPHTVPFNKPFHNQLNFGEVIAPSFDCSSLFRGKYANLVHQYFKENYGSEEVVLTASCTNALELAALLLDLAPLALWRLAFGDAQLKPLGAGETIDWRFVG